MVYQTLQYCAKVMQAYFAKIRGFSWLFDEKISNFDGSEFATKSHDNSWCLLFPTTWIFERQFARNENILRIFLVFDKWLIPFEQNFALYLLCSNIPTHFWTIIFPVQICRSDSFLMSLHSVSFTANLCLFIQQADTRLTCITSKVPFTVYFTLKASQLVHHSSLVVSWLTLVEHKGHSLIRPCLRNPDSARTGFCITIATACVRQCQHAGTQSFPLKLSCGNHAKSFQLHANKNRASLQARSPPSWDI